MIKWYSDVNTIEGFWVDNSLILSSFVPITSPIPVYSECVPWAGPNCVLVLPSVSIARHLRYYDGIRLPLAVWLPSFIALWAILHFWRATWVSRVATHTLYIMPGSPTPEWRQSASLDPRAAVLPSSPLRLSARLVWFFRGSITFRPNAYLSTLKDWRYRQPSMTRYRWNGCSLPNGISTR